MEHRWRWLFLKIAVITMLLASFGGIITSQTAHADTCGGQDSQGAFSVCAIAGGSVSVVKPAVYCLMIGSAGGSINNMQGCNGSNWEKIGFSNFRGVQEWVQRYGWTYSGTGDGYRYFTFNNYVYFQVDDPSTWWITYSDGNEYQNHCYGAPSGTSGGCDYNAWQNYITDFHSPTAQFRDWVTTGRPGNQALRPLEYPQPGLPNCAGSETGSTGNVQVNLGYTTNGGTVGVTGSSSYKYSLDGECNDGGVDAYSTYMNLNWGGVTCPLGICEPNATQSPLSFFNVTSTNGPNGANNNIFWQGWNLTVNWWYNPNGTIDNIDLHGNQNVGPNGNAAEDEWTY